MYNVQTDSEAHAVGARTEKRIVLKMNAHLYESPTLRMRGVVPPPSHAFVA